MNRENEEVLTLGIFAHANAGKTTITEHLLYHEVDHVHNLTIKKISKSIEIFLNNHFSNVR